MRSPIGLARSLAVVCVSAWLLVGSIGGAAEAALVTVDYAGIVTSVAPELSGTFSVGDAIGGSYTYDTTAVDISPSPAVGSYIAVTGGAGSIGTYSFTHGVGTVSILDNFVVVCLSGAVPVDCYSVGGNVSAPDVSGSPVTSFGLGFEDTDGVVFGNDSLPPIPPPLSQFEQTQFSLGFEIDEDRFAFVRGTISALSVVSVPEPSTLVVFGTGLTLGALRWRRRRT